MPENNPVDTASEQLSKPLTKSRMVEASVPMDAGELQEFVSRLNGGWNAVARMPPAQTTSNATASSVLLPDSDGTHKTRPPEPNYSDDIYKWISDTLDLHSEKDARSHADAARREFLILPCSNEVLLRFFRAFADAYEKMVRQRCDIPSSSANPSARITIAQASAQHQRTLWRLNRLAIMERERPDAADIFRLSEFAGCTADEIGLYLHIPSEIVAKRIENHTWDIYDDGPTA